MSVHLGEGGAADEEAPSLSAFGGETFSALMDALVADEAGSEAGAPAEGAGAAAAPAAPAGTDSGRGSDVPVGAGDPPAAGGTDESDGAAARGDQGAPDGSAEQPAAGTVGDDRPGAGALDAATLIPKFGELSTALEENTSKAYQSQALETVREEHAQYFEALEKHPRLLVGQQVPAIGKEGFETLRDTNDAREWQEAVKSILVEEVRDRASRQMEESKDFLQTVHASIELFQNNADLVPFTKNFDKELADKFAAMTKPYELRVDGKLQGYSIPVQPIIDQLRQQVTQQRAQAAPPASAAAPGAPAPAPARKAAEPPQAGIPSKSGTGSNSEDFSTLFGTIGLPNLKI